MGKQEGDGNTIRLEDDGQSHNVEVYCAVVEDRIVARKEKFYL
jgi:hypothetical protein